MTQLLSGVRAGDEDALERLLPLVYGELRRLAQRQMGRERGGHTLQPTALVHESFLRLVGQEGYAWESRGQFFGVAAIVMRRVLVEHARKRRASKRGGAATRLPLDETPEEALALTPVGDGVVDVLAVDAALSRLAAQDPRKAQVIELRFFGGLELEEIAEAMAVSLVTVKRDLAFARAWLYRLLVEDAPVAAP